MSPFLSPGDLLVTTRAVRRRLDFDRPLDLNLVGECLARNMHRVPVMVIPCISGRVAGPNGNQPL